jgi:hypothetical protein
MKKIEFSKLVVIFLMIQSTIWIYLSYYLALLGMNEIAENLSKTIVVEIIGIIAVYSCKSLFENLSKNNNWPDKPKDNNINENINRDC